MHINLTKEEFHWVLEAVSTAFWYYSRLATKRSQIWGSDLPENENPYREDEITAATYKDLYMTLLDRAKNRG